MQPPGWYYAQGDPPNTTRYWDGSAWTGPARVSDEGQVAGAPERMPVETTSLSGRAGTRSTNHRTQQPKPGSAATVSAKKTRFERLVSGGIPLLLLGMVLGICSHNIVTLFSTPAHIEGTVTDFTQASGGKRGYRIEITSNVGVFYSSGRASSFPMQVSNGLEVTVSYSERTGGLVAIDDFDQDRRPVGQFVWPAVAIAAGLLALAKIYYSFGLFRDGELLLAFVMIALVVGPLGGWVATGLLDSVVTSVMQAP